MAGANGHANLSADALALAVAEYRVFPLNGDKKPLTDRGFHDASADPSRVRAWWEEHPHALIGLAVPDRCVVVDLDTYKPEYRKDHGLVLPPTVMQETRRTGWQLFYRTDGRSARQTEGEAAPAVDTRVGGLGYVVAWQPEVLLASRPDQWAAAPDWVYERAGSARPIEGDIPEGRRHGDLLSLAGSMRARGMTGDEIYAALSVVNRERVKPPKPDDEVRRIASDYAKKPILDEGELVMDDEPAEPEEAAAPWPDPPDAAAFHGVLGDITRAVAPHTEAHPVAILGTLLAMFGTACGGTRSFYQGGMQRTNLSVLLVGKTGMAGRKGTALDVGRSVARLVYPELEELWLVGVASGEGVTGHMRRHDGGDDRPYEPRVLLVETEFGRLLTIMNREGSTLSAVLRNAWDGVPMGYSRARDEAQITDHHVSLLGHITPAELKAKLTEVDTANGFVNRILFLAVRREQLLPFPVSPDELVRPHREALHTAIVEAHAPGAMTLDAGGRDRWATFYRSLEDEPQLGLAGAVSGRHATQVARLALTYALADRAPAIGTTHLEAAIALAEYARRSVVWALGDSTGNRHADVLRRMLDEEEIGWKEAKQTLGLRTAADIAEVVAVLVDAGLAEVITRPRPGGGRALRVIRAKGAKGAKDARGRRADTRDSAT